MSNRNALSSMTNRRKTRRAFICIAVKERVGDSIHLCQASNISPDGIFLARVADQTGRIGERCELEFSLPGSEISIMARGRAVWRRQYRRYSLMAIRFSSIAPSHRRLIQSYVEHPTLWASSPVFLPPLQ